MNPPDETPRSPASTRDRLRRPIPAREHPTRGAGTMFRPAESVDDDMPRRREGSVERAVDGAYRILEDHLRRGREHARTQGAEAPMRPATPLDPQDLPRRLTRAWTDMMFMWLDLVTPLASAVGERTRGPAPHVDPDDRAWREVADPEVPGPRPEAPGPGSSRSFEVDLVATQGARVRLHLDCPPGLSLGVRKLRRDDEDETPLDAAISLTVDDRGVPKLSVTLRGEASPGVYVGTVFDPATKTPRGHLSIELGA